MNANYIKRAEKLSHESFWLERIKNDLLKINSESEENMM